MFRWSFDGDLPARLETFERQLAQWEKRAGERISDQLRIGIVLNTLPDNTLKEHVLINSVGDFQT